MKKIKYSFIIPAYNSSKTIKSCLDSLCVDIIKSNMNLNVEVIVVENGSTDSTACIVKDYMANSCLNIKIINSEKGVSKARNAGIVESAGEFIIFVDSDDLWLLGSLIEIQKNVKQYHSDLYLYSFIKGTVSDDFERCLKVIHDFNKTGIGSNIIDTKAWMISKPTFRMQVWGKVFRSDIIKKDKIYFVETLKYSEDSEFVIRYMKKCNEISVFDYPIYKYTISVGSVMRSFDATRINGYIESLEYSKEILKNESLIIEKAFTKYILSHLNIILVHDVFEVKRKSIKNHLFIKDYKRMKELLKNDIFSNAIKKIKISDCFSIVLLPELFIKLHLEVITAILCYFKSYLNYKKEISNKKGEML